jgi:hypothetical protein
LEFNGRIHPKGVAMRDLPRVGFLLIVDAILVAALVMLVGGCVVTPSRLHYQHGDFVMHVGSNMDRVAAPRA